MPLKNSENEAPQKLDQIALRASIFVQSHLRRAIADAGDFPVNFGIPPNLFLLVASTTLRILARCRNWSFSTVSLNFAPKAKTD
jgi:hypothetical protein